LPRYCKGDEITKFDTEWEWGWHSEKENAHRTLMGKPTEQDHTEGLGTDGRIELERILIR
jgi:hypothetical protein